MSAPAPTREFRIGDVLVRTGQVLSRNLLTFVLLVGITQLISVRLGAQGHRPVSLGSSFLVLLLQISLGAFSSATVVFAAFQDLRGRPVSAAESFRRAVTHFFPLAIASILVTFAHLVGVVLFLAPGLYAIAAMAVTIPACIVERLGPLQSISRSIRLTSGNRKPILGVGISWLLIGVGMLLVIQRALPPRDSLPALLATWVWSTATGSYFSVYAAILYHDLRVAREGIGIDEIAAAFD